MLNGSRILITGGAGSFGREFARIVLSEYEPARYVTFSRDEAKHSDMRLVHPDTGLVRYFIGDVRDLPRLRRALHGIDTVIHAAALKQVPAAEYQPAEAIKTNILGTMNVVDAAIDAGVDRVVLVSTDKAVHPVNLYGATKACAEKLMVQANSYSGADGTRFSAVRYGNVLGSRGSVVPLFEQQRRSGTVTLTDKRMTRYFLTLEQGVRFVLSCLELMQGGEIFVPKIPTVWITTLAKVMAPDCAVEETGIRPGEKLHELLVSEDEARHSIELDDRFVICPPHAYWPDPWVYWSKQGKPATGAYSSKENDEWLTIPEIKALLSS